MRGAWIEIPLALSGYPLELSLPVRGAWIEIIAIFEPKVAHHVAPCEGSVD